MRLFSQVKINISELKIRYNHQKSRILCDEKRGIKHRSSRMSLRKDALRDQKQ